VQNYGGECWELDALSPVILREEMARCIESRIDIDEWERCEEVERVERESLIEVMGHWKAARGNQGDQEGHPHD
jgi:hypothetical protein